MTTSSIHGFHYFPDDRHYSASDLAGWLPVLRSFGSAWLVLRASSSRSVPEAFLRGLLDEGIRPVVHLPARIGRLSAAEVSPLLSAYATWGVRHVVLYDRPNLRSTWDASEWGRIGLVERFLDRMIPMWALQLDLGLTPMVPPLEPGGDYWDTAFLEATLKGLARRGQESLLDSLALSGYAWTYGRSLEWGVGGPSAWPETRPYHTPESSQDQRGLRLPEWYSAISESACGRPLPLYILGGGAVPPPTADEPSAAFEQNAGVARWLFSDEIPASLQMFAFFLLAAGPTDPEAHAAWFRAPDAPNREVDLVRRALGAASKRTRPKTLGHYILLPPGTPDPALWALAGRVVARSPGTVGFSVDEARHASRVTVLASDASVEERLTEELERGGAHVERLTPASLESDEVMS